MRPTQYAFNAARRSSILKSIPVELTPLFVACGIACCSAIYFTTKKLRTDKTLRLGRTSPVFTEKYEEVINSKAE